MSIRMKTALCVGAISGVVLAQAPPPPAAPPTAPKARSVANVVIQRSSGSYLGVAVVEIDADRAKALKLKEERGVEVKLVDENSPASKAGLKEGDAILEFNGQRIEGTAQFVRMVSETPVGRKESMQISRNGATQMLTVAIEARSGRGGFSFGTGDMTAFAPMPPMPAMPAIPAMPDMPWNTPRLGIETESLNPQLAEYFGVKEGVLIRSVNKGSAAERAGLKAGDVVTRVNGDAVRNAGDISMKMLPGRASKTVSLTIMRNHKEMNVEAAIGTDRRSEALLAASCYTA